MRSADLDETCHTLPSDPRLVVTDMDGTLLDPDGRMPEELWPLIAELRKRDIVFAVASGRQFATLSRLFAPDSEGLVFIAENGAYVVRDGHELSSSPLDRDCAERVVHTVRGVVGSHDIGLVWCGRQAAYIERRDSAFVWEAAKYYANLEIVDDLLQVAESPLKFAVFDVNGTRSGSAPVLERACNPYALVVSSNHWMDIQDPAVHKGVAVRSLRAELGVSRDQTLLFADYLNDLEMIEEATYSYAMANAHPAVIERAGFVAPSNRDLGVITTLRRLLALEPERAPDSAFALGCSELGALGLRTVLSPLKCTDKLPY